MKNRAYPLLLIIMLCIADAALAQQPVRVAILPLEVFAQQDTSYLKQQIPEAMKTQLEQQGARVIVLDQASLTSRGMRMDSVAAIRQIGLETGDSYVIWGGLTWFGQNFSLDMQMLPPGGVQNPLAFSAEGAGVENLPATVQALVQKMSLKLFKRETIVEIQIKGNQRIEEDAVRRILKLKKGDIYNPKDISDELKSVYAMGYFDDVRVDAKTVADGKIIIITLKEKPTVRSILVEGNTWVYDDEKIKENLTLRKGSILNINTLQSDMRRIEELYKEKNFYNVKVKFNVYPRKENQADIEYEIDEGQKFLIQKIEFVGNSAYSDDDLKDEMDTSEENMFSWLTSAGELNEENLGRDIAKLTAFYHNNGYVMARVGEPEIKFEESGIVITVRVVEGAQFKVGEVNLAGDLIIPAEQLMEKIKIVEHEYFNRDALRLDVITLSDIYADEGYANVDIAPRIKQDNENSVVHITLEIAKGQQVYFEDITISGNSRTRDKVIRRELQVYEQELYGGKRLKRSIRNLYRLDYFEDVKVDTVKGSAEDKMKLRINVKEKNTGAFAFGGGYGNVESFFATASISDRNLAGRGQTLSLKANLGSTTTRYTLGFTEPWLFDIPLVAGADIYNWQYRFSTYDKNSIGTNLRLGYPLIDYSRILLTYTYDIADIKNVDDDAADSIKRDEGKNIKSSLSPSIKYDSRNDAFHPTEGSMHSVTYEFAGLGGTIGFNKVIGETAWYLPFYKKIVGVLHGRTGYVKELEGKRLPDYEKFYMVGLNGLRGFERDDLSPRDENGSEIGATKYVVGNLEIRFPLFEQAGLYGFGFFDTGNGWAEGDDPQINDLRESAGVGFRWRSPMGPISLAYGWILDPKSTDHGPGGWEFSMASAF
ncbi:MAG: outer membrane protein assembly factor BamA [Deltaproteobacteria bacterium]|jgi:outer membrane protein insertion porin family|nr:outer membrane protein assembly factor BamA [Deltaproteobacteria bacterium]